LKQLIIDPGEKTNLARQYPERLEELKAAWESYAEELVVILGAE
jgi:hypothetical protein